ncbi:unnamed protein product [Gongylonema pulchrum]|uniref:Proteasome endopeptidase complex n=1 Tax=Gongylonema pulchrum TaxID=637853 RepID=A0A183E8I0_9BILA|nr:unnamed protein product [Gongylonema pulchrum]
MFLTRSEYDRGVNTFSPEGRLFQVEYAIEAVKLGSTSIGIRTTEGVVLAAEKRATSKLMVNDGTEKISKVDSHVGKLLLVLFDSVTFAGLIADSRTLVERAQLEAQNFWFTYNQKMRVEDVTMSVANLALQFGDDDAKASMSRPFGVAMLFAGIDQDGPRLYVFHLDPSGTFIDCLAKAIGAASDGAEQTLKEQYHEVTRLIPISSRQFCIFMCTNECMCVYVCIYMYVCMYVCIFHLDPSGTFIDCLAKAIGAASDGAEQTLKEQKNVGRFSLQSMTLAEAEKSALFILKQVMEEKLTNSNVEVVAVKPTKDSKGHLTGTFERLTKEQLDAIIAVL